MAAAKFTLSGVFVLIFRQGVVMIAFSTLLSNLLVTLIGIYSLRDPKDVFGISLEYIRMDRLFIKKLIWYFSPCDGRKFAFSTGKVVVNFGRSGLWYPDSRRFGSVQQYQRIVYGSGRKHR